MRPGPPLNAVLDRMVEGGLIALVIFTPLAFGAVATWAVSLMQAGLVLVFALWLIRIIWWRSPARFGGAMAKAQQDARWRPFGYRFISTGMGLPALAFAILVIVQLVPLPRVMIAAVSPAADRLYVEALPGWGERAEVDFSRLEEWVDPPGGAVVSRILASDPGDPVLANELTPPAARTLSIYPYATWGRLLTLLALMAAFAVAVHAIRSAAMVERFAWVVSLLGLAMSVFAVVQRLQWNGRIYGFHPVGDDASPFGPFLNHNHFAAWMEMAAPLAFGLFLSRFIRLGGGSQEGGPTGTAGLLAILRAVLKRGPDPLARLGMSAFAGVVMLAALLMSGSRGAILSLAAAMTLYGGLLAIRGQTGRIEWAVAIFALVFALIFATWAGADQVQEAVRRLTMVTSVDSEPSLAARVVGWRYTLRIVADYPLLGSGLGTFPEAWLGYYPPGTANVWQEAHNDYLQIASETGLVGLGLVLWGMTVFMKRHLFAHTLGEAGPAGPDAYLLHGISIGILALLFHSWVDFSLQVPAVALLFVILAGVMAGAGAARRDANA